MPSAPIPLTGPFAHEGGFAWRADLPPFPKLFPGNTLERPFQSRLVVMEGDAPLAGPRHAQLADIARHGGGRFNHWQNALYLSASDSGDPNRNGRAYALAVAEPPPGVLALGTCHADETVRAAAGRGLVEARAPYAVAYTTRDILQLIRRIAGEYDGPTGLEGFDSFGGRAAQPEALAGLGGVVLEVSSRTVLEHDGLSLAPNALWREIVAPAATLGETTARAAARWHRFGLMRLDDAVRRETAAVLLDALGALWAADDPRLTLIRNLRPRDQSDAEVARDMAQIVGRFEAPLVLLLHTQRYMPDGRPLRWPSGFHALLRAIAEDFGAPVLDPGAMIEARGAATTLTDDLRHHAPAFTDDLADLVLARLGLAA